MIPDTIEHPQIREPLDSFQRDDARLLTKYDRYMRRLVVGDHAVSVEIEILQHALPESRVGKSPGRRTVLPVRLFAPGPEHRLQKQKI